MSIHNPRNSGSVTADSTRWGPGQVYSNGYGQADGFGHGHYNPQTGYDRPAWGNLLGGIAIQGAAGEKSAGLGR